MSSLPGILKCRICLGDVDEGEMSSLFEGEGGDSDLREKFELCCRIRVRQSPQLPGKACSSCCEFVHMWLNFRQMCLNSQVYWETSSSDSERPEALDQASDAEYMEYLYESLQLKLGTENKDQDEVTAIEEEQLEDQSQEILDFDGFIINESIEEDEDPITESPEQMLIPQMDSYVDDLEMEELIDDRSEFVEELASANDEYYEVEYEELLLSTAPSPHLSLKMDKRKPGRPRKPDGELKFKRKEINAKEKGSKSKSKDEDKFMCSLCGNVYYKKSIFTAHMITHSEYKPHQCEICTKSFRQMGELRAHIRRHTGERPYKCMYCDRHFYDRSERVRHERVHTNTRPYACQECGKTFTHTAILKNHILSHSGKKNYNCDICCKGFTLLHQLKAHLQTLTHRNKIEQSIPSSAEMLES
ncbi:zinc finger protein 771 [Drosophila erecta]|uniref:GG18266 n=1 Tax=Drosophila erecta TaxID=7220 RepID=B3P4I6_DROER|nr:zinc finger protein 771 [Drosophila erecta]EDV49501.1 uncharacterized protein Dere_GG18266 [Drosophila erecta]